VEEVVQFNLWFGTGAMVTAMASYGSAESRQWIITTEKSRFVMDPAFSYRELKLNIEQKVRGITGGGRAGGGGAAANETKNVTELVIPEQNQFALEMDHFAQSIFDNKPLRTPGEEGLKDMLLIEAIYQAAQSGQRMKL
jgi:predicted dehydrogenase